MNLLSTLLSLATNHLELVIGFVVGVLMGHAVPWLYSAVVGLFSSSSTVATTVTTDVSSAVNAIESAVGSTTNTASTTTNTTTTK